MNRAQWNIRGLLLIAAFCLTGCPQAGSSPGPETPPDLDAEYAVETKAMVLDFASAYKKDAKAAQGELESLAEHFEGMDEWPVTKHKDIYRQLAQKVQRLAGDPSALTPQSVDELAKLAEQLPGDVAKWKAEQGTEEGPGEVDE